MIKQRIKSPEARESPMLKNLSPKVCLTSLFVGVIVYFISAGFFEKIYALLFSILFALIMMIVMPFILYFDERKYRNIHKNITDDILLREKVNCNVQGTVRNGYILITKYNFYFFSYDKKNKIEMTVPREDIASAKLININQIVLRFGENDYLIIISLLYKEILEALCNLKAGKKVRR